MRRASKFVAFVTFLLPAAAAAEGPLHRALDAVNLEAPGGAADKYIVGGFKTPEDWQFLMGPKGAQQMSLKLLKADRSGSIGFLCRRDGTRQLAVTFPGLTVDAKDNAELSVAVGAEERLLKMRLAQQQPTGGVALEADGMAVSAILEVMGAAPSYLGTKLRFSLEQGKEIAFDLTRPRNIAATAAVICKGWADAAHRNAALAQ